MRYTYSLSALAWRVQVTRIVNRPIMVRVGRDGRPSALRWPQTWHSVATVLDEWVYRKPWWETSFLVRDPGEGGEDVSFYRVACADGRVLEVCLSRDGWRLYREFD